METCGVVSGGVVCWVDSVVRCEWVVLYMRVMSCSVLSGW